MLISKIKTCLDFNIIDFRSGKLTFQSGKLLKCNVFFLGNIFSIGISFLIHQKIGEHFLHQTARQTLKVLKTLHMQHNNLHNTEIKHKVETF